MVNPKRERNVKAKKQMSLLVFMGWNGLMKAEGGKGSKTGRIGCEKGKRHKIIAREIR